MQFIEHLATHPDYKFKILVVGNHVCGQVQLPYKAVQQLFFHEICFYCRWVRFVCMCSHKYLHTRVCTHTHTHTTGVDFYTKALAVDDRTVTLHIWDTAGQERFQSVTKSYYRGAHGIILMYDITQEESFVAVKSWINSIEVQTIIDTFLSSLPPPLPTTQEHSDHMPSAILLVGNKADLDRYGRGRCPGSMEWSQQR